MKLFKQNINNNKKGKIKLKTFFSSFLLAAVIGFTAFFTGCSENSPVMPETKNKAMDIVSIGGGSNSITLFAGQTINAGTVSFDDIDTDNNGVDDILRVTYNTINGWQIMEIHFAIGNTLSDIPMNKGGNPVPGQFPYKFTSLNGVTTYTFDIPFSVLGISCPNPGSFSKTFAAHASLRKLVNGSWQTETGWGDGPRINTRGSWAEYNTFTLTCDELISEDECNDTETSFAYGGSSAVGFNAFGFEVNANRWGWTNSISPSASPYTFDVYAGAGQNDLSKGIKVGTLTVNYNNGSATVTWNLNAGHEAKEFHLYAGSDPLPTKNGEYTVAPGQFPYKHSVSNGVGINSHTFTITGLSGNIYVVAHATVKDC